MAAKDKKTVKNERKSKQTFLSGFSIDNIIPTKYQTILFLVIILVVFLLFYYPLYFGGKTFQSGDIVTSVSIKSYVENHKDGYTLWNPYIFTGMPAYALAVGYKWFNLIYVVTNAIRAIFTAAFTNQYAMWTFYLVALAYAMYFVMIEITKNKLISLFSSFVVSFSTGIVVFLYIGHVTKLTALFVFPIILLLLLKYQTKIKFLDVMLLMFFMPVMFLGWHVQIIFYIFFAVLIYFLYYFSRALKTKDKFLLTQLLKSAVIFIFATVVGLGILSDNFTQIWEYTPYSTRGTQSVVDIETSSVNKSETDFYKYATNWSFSPGEILTWIVPSYYGFGKIVYNGPLSQNQDVEINTYFGQMPFVDVAQYMGVIVFFLAILSIVINWETPFVRYLTILIVIATLISFGRTFPIVYDLMFHYFPFFDKFRVPSMILVLVQVSMPILAGLGIAKIISLKNENNKKYNLAIRNIFYGLSIVFILTLLLASPIKSWFIDHIIASGQKGAQLQPVHDFMADVFLSDLRWAFFFSAAAFGLILAFINSLLSKDLLVISIIILSLIDIFRIDKRGETYIEQTNINNLFQKPEYVSVIESFNDKDPFRILNLKQDGSLGSIQQNSNFNSYFLLQDLYGYSGIKPRAYQDYMDVLGSPANPTLWRMTNTRYIVLDSPTNIEGLVPVYSANKTYVYKNENALPRAFFVNQVQKAGAIEILKKVKNNQFDPKEIAFLEDTLLNIDRPDTTAFVKINKYADEEILMDVNSNGNNFLFLGDTYYGKPFVYKIPILNIKLFTSHKWRAYIDGKETTIYRVNHNFRGIVVPKGEHKVEFKYLPESFMLTKYISLVLSSLVVLGLIVAVGLNVSGRKKSQTNNQ